MKIWNPSSPGMVDPLMGILMLLGMVGAAVVAMTAMKYFKAGLERSADDFPMVMNGIAVGVAVGVVVWGLLSFLPPFRRRGHVRACAAAVPTREHVTFKNRAYGKLVRGG